MSDTPFMPLWVSDFVGDTLDLDAKEIGAYMLLLMTMWGRDGYLPNDSKKLQRVARCGRDWPRVWASIEHFFTVENGKVTQKRLLKELQKVASKREVNAQNGARGGRSKSLKNKEQDLANASNSLKQPEPYPYKEKEIPKGISKKKAARLSPDWVLPTDWGEWAMCEGLSRDEVIGQAERFRDYWIAKAGKDAAKLDWQATWRNWIRNAKKRGHANGKQISSSAADKARLAADRFAARRMDSGQGASSSIPLLSAQHAARSANGRD